MMKTRQSGHAVLIVVIVILVIALLGLLGWLFWQNINKSGGSSVSNFEQCKAAAGSKLLETYPEQCVTSDGRSFTGPVKQESIATKSYCAEAEKICFDYREDWTIAKVDTSDIMPEPGAKIDMLEITSPDKEMVMTLQTGIGGLGGTCPDENKVTVHLLTAIPAVKMTGFKSEYSLDTLRVVRAYYPEDTHANSKFVTAVYLSGAEEYGNPGTLNTCGIGFSEFMAGRNASFSSEASGAGSFRFGYFGSLNDSAIKYDTEAEAKAAFDSDVYRQAVSLLASAHYE